MTTTDTDEIGQVLRQVSMWPIEKRLVLTQKILASLTGDIGNTVMPRKSLENLVGLLRTESPPPSDEECEKIREEELLRKQ